MDQLKAQVDASLTVMADAVETLRLHVGALAAAPAQSADMTATITRLKAGTDTLAAAVAQAKTALAGATT